MPAQQRRGRDQKDRPPLPRQQLRQRSQHHPIRRRISRTHHLAMEHRHLVPKDRDFYRIRVGGGPQPKTPRTRRTISNAIV
jgi:hypothetical protein